MRRNSVNFGLSLALLLGSGGPALAAAAQIDVQGMTVVDDGSKTKALIEVPDGIRYSVFVLANPNRLVLDLPNSRLAGDFRIPGPDGVVSNVRTGEPVPGDVRLVFDLAAKVRPKSYFQNRDGHAQLVIELPTAAGGFRFPAAKTIAAKPVQPDALPEHPVSAPPDPVRAGSPVSTAIALPTAAAVSTAVPLGPSPAAAQAIAQSDEASQPLLAASQSSAPRHPTVVEPRHDNSRADPLASSVVTASQPEKDVQAAAVHPDDPVPVSRPGARTLRDVIGAGQRKIMIAVDAGHGGQDVGAKGYNGSYEKNVTLATARELARQINATPGMQAVLTRDGDYFVPLADRYHKAREAKADLFVSIHADADPTHTATGSSVWVLSERGVTSQAAKWLADRENAADLIGGVSLSDKDNTLASVLLDLSQSATMKASEDAAERVHQALRDIGRTHKAHPERANFVVLRSPDVPSMLVETAFITNYEEERHLNDAEYRGRLAAAVLSGVRSYFVDNPLPGTEFAALHERSIRNVRTEAQSQEPRMIQASMRSSQDTSTEPALGPTSSAPVQLATAEGSAQYHVVQPGERLIDIASQYGVSPIRLREANDLPNYKVQPGQQLRIPARAKSG